MPGMHLQCGQGHPRITFCWKKITSLGEKKKSVSPSRGLFSPINPKPQCRNLSHFKNDHRLVTSSKQDPHRKTQKTPSIWKCTVGPWSVSYFKGRCWKKLERDGGWEKLSFYLHKAYVEKERGKNQTRKYRFRFVQTAARIPRVSTLWGHHSSYSVTGHARLTLRLLLDVSYLCILWEDRLPGLSTTSLWRAVRH